VLTINDEDFFEEATIAILRNAKQYIKDEEILCSFRNYCHALAITILDNVEMGKSASYNLAQKT